MNGIPSIRASLTLLPELERGRNTLWRAYRPHIVIGPADQRKAKMAGNACVERYHGAVFMDEPAQSIHRSFRDLRLGYQVLSAAGRECGTNSGDMFDRTQADGGTATFRDRVATTGGRRARRTPSSGAAGRRPEQSRSLSGRCHRSHHPRRKTASRSIRISRPGGRPLVQSAVADRVRRHRGSHLAGNAALMRFAVRTLPSEPQ
jgi:hypothetical protein